MIADGCSTSDRISFQNRDLSIWRNTLTNPPTLDKVERILFEMHHA